MPFIALIINGLAQTIQISENKKPEYENNYVSKENLSDTTYIVLDFERKLLDIRKVVQDIGDYKINYIEFTMSYPLPTASNNIVSFSHFARPPFGHEEYSVNKKSIPKDKLLGSTTNLMEKSEVRYCFNLVDSSKSQQIS
jgi:hypothetical protein